ncbi:MAG: DUF4870 domain-containing protein [Eubacteriaceae bacterium]
MENKIYEPHKSSIGNLDANVVALIAYIGSLILGYIPIIKYVAFLVPIIIFIIEKESKFVKFHAMQSILLCAVSWIISIILVIFRYSSVIWILFIIIGLTLLVFYIIGAVKSYKYELYKMPLIGNWAEKIALK